MSRPSECTRSQWLMGAFILLIVAVGAVCWVVVTRQAGPAASADDTARGFFANLLKPYTPRQACMYFERPVIWLHLMSDLLIAAAYYSIPIALIYFARRRRDLPFNWVYVLFAAFILACGTTHLFGAFNLWLALYRVDGIIKFATAILSVATAIVLWPLIPRALSLPSHAQLEERVRLRTAELADANEALRREIDGRKAAEAQREELLVSERAAREEAERANRMKDEFLATVSHELRTPLNAILGWSELLNQRPSPDPEIAEGIEVIQRNARAQAQLVEDLLDLSRIISGRLRLHVQPVDLREVVQAATQAVAPAADARRIDIRPELPEGLPPIAGDFGRLQQVVWNLLSNAVKFTPPDGRVSITLAREDDSLRLTVSDTGEGMTPEFQRHLFERFRQADSSPTRRHGGLGIGLAIVRHLVELHGGTVSATSPGSGQGSTFTVLLPVRAMPQQGPEAAPAANADPAYVSLDGLRILVVEDDPDARRLVKRLLEESGAAVMTAGSAADAWRALPEERPDLIVCDISMPGEDGYTLMQRIRAHADPRVARIPAAALTAYARAIDREHALQAGFQVHLAKPVHANDLLRALAMLAGRNGADARE